MQAEEQHAHGVPLGFFQYRQEIRAAEEGEGSLRRTLTASNLTLLGIGAIIGAGIFVLTGNAAALYAGPGVVMSMILAGVACGFAGLCYAEFAAMIPISGSAYTYPYVVLGELLAWIVGWSLILEYSLVVSAVAVGWSGYAAPLLHAWAGFPIALSQGPELGGIINLPAMFIIVVVTVLLVVGIRESARFNGVIVAIKLIVILLFILRLIRR